MAWLLHGLRIMLVVALLAAIPKPQRESAGSVGLPPSVDRLRGSLPDGDVSIETLPSGDGSWKVRAADGTVSGYVARTMPQATDAIGYRGPTEAWLVMNQQHQITDVGILHSEDTAEHVRAVAQDQFFLDQFTGRSLDDPLSGDEIDGVSGATLTSLAMAEGILLRMGGQSTSLLFPDPIDVDEIRDWYPDAASVAQDGTETIVRDATGEHIGCVTRTGPLCDDVIGYQGSSEVLLRIDQQGQVTAARLRESLDNEPYVGYVRKESYFWQTMTGCSVAELAELNLVEAGIEGVSGATMSSVAIAETMVRSAAEKITRDQAAEDAKKSWWKQVRVTTTDFASVGFLIVVGLASQLSWFRHRGFRTIWLITVVLGIGFWSGNLLSLSLISGWAAEGVAWRLAPGLAMMAMVALLAPPATKGNPYCNHLCPHGALQQLVRPSSKSIRRWTIPNHWMRRLMWLPGVTLSVAYIMIVTRAAVDLSAWEPFHAYLFRIAGWASLAFAGGTILLSVFVPMGYCRVGCPTGSLLDYLRRTSRSDRLRLADVIACGLLILAWMVH